MPKQSGTRKTAQKLSPRIVRALFDMVINFPPHRSTSQPTTKAWSRLVAACRECHGLSKAPVCFALSMNARQAGVPCGASGQPYRQPACLLRNFTPLEQISRGVHQCPRGAEKFVDESPPGSLRPRPSAIFHTPYHRLIGRITVALPSRPTKQHCHPAQLPEALGRQLGRLAERRACGERDWARTSLSPCSTSAVKVSRRCAASLLARSSSAQSSRTVIFIRSTS